MKVILVLFALFAVAYSNSYDVEVKLGSKAFDKIEKTALKLVIIGPHGQQDVFRIKEKADLTPSSSYVAEVKINYELVDITNARFYWTLPSPHPPKYLLRKPSIYLDSVTIQDTWETVVRTGRKGITKFLPANPNQKVQHKQQITLVPKFHSE